MSCIFSQDALANFIVLSKYLLNALEMLHGGNMRKLEEDAWSNLTSMFSALFLGFGRKPLGYLCFMKLGL